jgi:hypothetical protein
VAKTLVLVAPSGNVRAVLAASERIDLHKVAGVGRRRQKGAPWRARTSSRANTRISSFAPYRRLGAAMTR